MGFLIAYSVICLGPLMLFATSALFAPSPPGIQIYQAVIVVLSLTAISFWIGFVALQGPIVATGLFLASVWFLVIKRLNFLTMFCCFLIASLGVPRVDKSLVVDLIPKDFATYSGIEGLWMLFLKIFPFLVAIFYVWIDPSYRNKHKP